MPRGLRTTTPSVRFVRERSRVTNTILEGANRVLNAALSSTSASEFGEACLAIIDELTGSAFGFIGELAEDGTMRDVAISNPGWEACELSEKTGHRKTPAQFPITGVYGRVLETGEAYLVNDVETDEHSAGVPEGHPPLTTFLGVPLKQGDTTIGMIGVANRPGGYRDEDRTMLEYLAPSIAAGLRGKRTSERLGRSNQLLIAHMENSPLAVVEFDQAFHVTRWSEGAERMFGYSEEEVVGHRISDLQWVYEEDMPLVEAETERMFSGRFERSVNLNRNYRKDGSVIWCEWYDSALFDDDGELYSVLSLVHDVTDRVAAEELRNLAFVRTELLLKAASALSSGRSLIEVLDTLCATVAHALLPSCVTVSLWDKARKELEVVASRGEAPVLIGMTAGLEELAPRVQDALLSKSTRVTDFERAPSASRSFGRSVKHAALNVPLVYGDELVGLLTIDDPEGGTDLDAEAMALVEGIASEAAVAVEGARMMELEREQSRLSAGLNDIEQEIHSAQEFSVIAQRALESGARLIGADKGSITLREPGGFRIVYSFGFDQEVHDLFTPDERERHSVIALRTKRPVLVEDAQNDPRVDKDHFASFKVNSAMVVPLLVAGEGVGNLYFDFIERHRFSAPQVEFARRLSSAIALAMDNARLLVSETEARIDARLELESSQLLLRAIDALSRPMDLDELLHEFAVIVADATSGKRVAVSMLDPSRTSFVIRAKSSESSTPLGTRFPVEGSPLQRLLTQTSSWVSDFEPPEGFDSERDRESGSRTRSALIVPLVSEGEVVGHLWIDEPGERFEVTERQRRLTEAIASHAAVAIERATLLERTSQQATYAQALNRIGTALHSTVDFDEIMRRVVQETLDTLRVDGVGVQIQREERWEVRYAQGLPSALVHALNGHVGDEENLAESVLGSREQLVANNLGVDSRDVLRTLSEHGMQAVMAMPLFVRGEGFGVLYACRMGEGEPFDDLQVDFARKVASSMSLALSNAAAYQSEREVAHTLQAAMITLPDRVPDIEFGYRYRSASEAALVGGDFYDLFEIDGDLLGITIGDISGKGIEAAATTSLVKNAIRSHATLRDAAPARALSAVNDVVYRDVAPGIFSTVFFAVLSRLSGRLTYANAGHTAALVIPKDGPVQMLEATGPILGAFHGATFGQETVDLGGSTLLLYTDGVTEARRGSELYGEERLEALVSDLRHDSTRELAGHVVADVHEFAGGVLRDDIALLALRRTGSTS